MADYSVLCENQQIEIGKAGENLARSCTIDYSAWLKEYGEGDLRIRAIRSGDAEPYPVTNVTTENGVATWIFTDADTAIKGYGEVQILYYVEDVLVKSRVWRTYTHRSLSTSSEEVPDPYQDWLSEVERIGSQIEEDAESASDSATRAAGSASEAAESALSATRSESSAQKYASAASSSADSAASSATAASRSATEASNYEYNSEQYMNEAKSAKFGAESARTGAENAKAAAQSAAQSIEESADLIQKLMDNQIKDTATGTIASFPDGADMPMVSLVADIDPIQDTSGGAPSPSNICPISGWDSVDVSVCGVNVWDEEWEAGTLSTDDGSNVARTTRVRSANYISVVPNETYYFKIGANGLSNGLVVCFYDRNKTFISGAWQRSESITIPNNAHYVRFSTGDLYGGTYNNDISINYPSTDHDYHAHEGQTYHTTLPQTVYGGTLDVVSGVLTVDRAMVDLGTLNWSAGTDSVGQYFKTNIPDIKPAPSATVALDAICSAYPVVPSNNVADGSIAVSSGGGKTVYARDFRFSDVASFTTGVNGVQFCYPPDTPISLNIDAQQIDSLLGRNNAWADSGDVTVEYIADTKLYIQKVMGAIG